MNTPPGRLVLLGHPVGHSLSPTFQNAALAAAGIPLTYELLDVLPDALPETLTRLLAGNAAGNVTIPHKRAVAAACDHVTAEAMRVGAVNAFVTRDQMLVGHNTDVRGFDVAARELLASEPRAMTVGLFGAGGAAAAVLAAVESWLGCTAIIVNRDPERGNAICERFRSIAQCGDVAQIAEQADLIVNATSLGMGKGEAGPIDPARLRAGTAVLDLVYKPEETVLVRAARECGLRTADGMSMLVAQGAAAFAWWFGRNPDVEVMWRAVGRSRAARSSLMP